jgi:Zn-dependent peptidase ImmA (M78 family)
MPTLPDMQDRMQEADFIMKAKRLVDEAGVRRPPVDPRRLAQQRGIRRIFVSRSLESSGQLLRVGEELVIRLSARDGLERQNFSCCHEIAHTFALDSSVGKLRQSDEALRCSSSARQERLCDNAAAEMLMPERLFSPLANCREPSSDSLVFLSKQFASSIKATVLRLAQLALWPVVFVSWKFTTKEGSTRKLRVAWSARPAGSRCYVPVHASADRASGMYATFSIGHPTSEVESLELGSLRGRYLVESMSVGQQVISIIHDPKLRRRK